MGEYDDRFRTPIYMFDDVEEYGSQARTSITGDVIGFQEFPIHSDCATTIRTEDQSDRLEGSVLVHRSWEVFYFVTTH